MKILKSAMLNFNDIKFELIWRPFQLNPDLPLEGIERKKYLKLKFKGEENAKKIYDKIYLSGLKYNIHFQFDKISKTPNSFLTHKLLALAHKFNKQTQVIETLFYDFFIEGVDIGEIDKLIRIAKHHNIYTNDTRVYLESTKDNENLLSEEKHARELGITGVPCFIINKKYVLIGAQEKGDFLKIFKSVINVN